MLALLITYAPKVVYTVDADMGTRYMINTSVHKKEVVKQNGNIIHNPDQEDSHSKVTVKKGHGRHQNVSRNRRHYIFYH